MVSSQLLQDELAERTVQLEKVKRAGKELVNTQESPTLKTADVNNTTGKFTPSISKFLNSIKKTHLQYCKYCSRSIMFVAIM